MPSDPIARWESDGGAVLLVDRLDPPSRAGANNAPGHLTEGSASSPCEPPRRPTEAPGPEAEPRPPAKLRAAGVPGIGAPPPAL